MATKLRPADLDASGAHRELRRLSDRSEVEVRDLVAVRLALRDQRVHGAHGVLGLVRAAARACKIITHHLGAMVPFFDGASGCGMDQFGCRTSDEDYEALLKQHGEAAGRLLQDVLRRHARSTARAAASAAGSISSARIACCSAPTARSTPRAGRCTCGSRPWRSTRSDSRKRHATRSISGTRCDCSSYADRSELESSEAQNGDALADPLARRSRDNRYTMAPVRQPTPKAMMNTTIEADI